MSDIRTRFAPSPTGYLHVGGARTALFNWLLARQLGGKFVLRVEDTDQERNTEAARKAIFDGLQWLGMDWDEGPDCGGEYGPYNQSERGAIYDRWFAHLQEKGRVYEDDGAWRFRFERKLMTMHDLICGEVSIDYREESNTPDMVVKRSDGSYVFHFVNVVDDLEMKISHVIRGEDHLMNTPKHLQLFEAFDVKPPIYAHIPLILNQDGSKMSKRDAGAAVGEYEQAGYLSGAVVNFLALLGWSPKNEDEIYSPAELIKAFSLEGVNRSPAKFDTEKCAWVNQQHLAPLSPEAFAKASETQFEQLPENYQAMAGSVQEKVRLLSEVPAAIQFYHDKEFPYAPEALEKVAKNAAAPALLNTLAEAWGTLTDWSEAKGEIKAAAVKHEAKPGQLMFPLRVALSGKAGGPDLGDILQILGQEESIRRIQRYLAL